MAGFALAVSVFLSLSLLSSAQLLRSDLPSDGEPLTGFRSELRDAAAANAIRLPSDKPSSNADDSLAIPKPEAAIGSTTSIAETLPAEPIAIEVSLIPIRRDFHPHWRRLGHRCRHLRGHGPLGGKVIPYGDDMVVPDEQVRRAFAHGGDFLGEARHDGLIPARMGGAMWKHAATKEISMEEMGLPLPREMRLSRRWHPNGDGEERRRGWLNRLLDSLNRH